MTRQKQVVVFPSQPKAMQQLDRLASEIVRAPSAVALIELINTAAGLQRKWRPIRDVADRAGELWVEAEAKLGEELDKLPKARGGGERGVGRRGKRMQSQVGTAFPPTLDELGIDKKLSTRARKVKDLGVDGRQRLIGELKAENKPINSSTVLALQRKHNKLEKKHAVAAAAFSETGPFDVVVIDPPWPMAKIDREVRLNQDSFDYPIMSEDELADFWTKEIVPKLKDDVHVFCWTTQRFVPAALRLVERWQLAYTLLMVWHKPGGFQPIDLPQFNCEFIVYARRGAPVFIDTKDFFCCFEAPRREHSRKPAKFYETIRRVTGGSRIDVFARETHEGFARYGNETDKFSVVGAEAAE